MRVIIVSLNDNTAEYKYQLAGRSPYVAVVTKPRAQCPSWAPKLRIATGSEVRWILVPLRRNDAANPV